MCGGVDAPPEQLNVKDWGCAPSASGTQYSALSTLYLVPLFFVRPACRIRIELPQLKRARFSEKRAQRLSAWADSSVGRATGF